MADRKKTTKAPVRAAAPTRSSRGKSREGAFFLVSPPRAGLPPDYAETLSKIKKRIQAERLRVVMAANTTMVLLYDDEKTRLWYAQSCKKLLHKIPHQS
jgi:hypothetical protein